MGRIVQVLIPMPLPEAFDYAEPEGMGLELGDHVVVPLGPQRLVGVVVGVRDAAGGNRPLKPVLERREEPPLPAGWHAWCGAEDPLLDAGRLHVLAPEIRVVSGATHHPAALLRAMAKEIA